jgi:hypothetical protein
VSELGILRGVHQLFDEVVSLDIGRHVAALPQDIHSWPTGPVPRQVQNNH